MAAVVISGRKEGDTPPGVRPPDGRERRMAHSPCPVLPTRQQAAWKRPWPWRMEKLGDHTRGRVGLCRVTRQRPQCLSTEGWLTECEVPAHPPRGVLSGSGSPAASKLSQRSRRPPGGVSVAGAGPGGSSSVLFCDVSLPSRVFKSLRKPLVSRILIAM